jgi:hypothetical protein
MTPAEEFFRADLARVAAEDQIGDIIDAAAGATGWYDFTADWYDQSIEVYFNDEPADPDAIAAKMFEAGFYLCWIHPHKAPRIDCRCPVRSAKRAGAAAVEAAR